MLLSTKLFRPQAPANYLMRPRLLAALDNGRRQALTLLGAPAGYGKTTLAAAWLEGAGAPAGWLSLDAHDNDPALFWQYVLLALQQARPGVGEAAQQALADGPAPPIPTLVNALINDLWQAYQRDPTQAILALDDYHLIHNPAIHETLNQLVDYTPPQALRLLVLTRADPPLKLARRRAQQQLCELRAADLRFTRAEIAGLFQQQPGPPLDDDLVARLDVRTEGWAAALHLAALSQPQALDAARLAASGGSQLVADFLLEEVLQQQPEAIRSFLLKTAVLEQFSADLAAYLLGVDDASDALAYLWQHHLFLVPLDSQRRWVRYHHLFAELLAAQAHKAFGAAALAELQRRASIWHAGQQMWAPAIDCALAAADAALAAQHLLAYLAADPSWLFVRPEWLHALPPAVADRYPLLYLAQAHLCFNDATGSRHGEMQTALARARAALDRMAEPQPDLEAHYAYLTAMQALLAGSAAPTDVLEQCTAAFERAPETAVHARGRLAYWVGLLYRRMNQTDQAARWLEKAQTLLLAANDAYVGVMAHVQLWENQIESGEATQKTLDALRAFKRRSPLVAAGHPISGAVYLTEATIWMYRGELAESTSAFEKGLTLIQLTTEYGMELRALWNLAFVRFAAGDAAGALALAEMLEERIPVMASRAGILRRWFTLPRYGADLTATAELDQWLAESQDAVARRAAAGEAVDDFFLLMHLFTVTRLVLRRQERARYPVMLALLQRQAEQFSAPALWRRCRSSCIRSCYWRGWAARRRRWRCWSGRWR